MKNMPVKHKKVRRNAPDGKKIRKAIEKLMPVLEEPVDEIIDYLTKNNLPYWSHWTGKMYPILTTLERNLMSVKNNNSFRAPSFVWGNLDSLKHIQNPMITGFMEEALVAFEPIWQQLSLYLGTKKEKHQETITEGAVICVACDKSAFSLKKCKTGFSVITGTAYSLSKEECPFIKKHMKIGMVGVVAVYMQKHFPEELECYCPTCDSFYCEDHYKSSGWQSVATGVDYQYRGATCPNGHGRTLEESYA